MNKIFLILFLIISISFLFFNTSQAKELDNFNNSFYQIKEKIIKIPKEGFLGREIGFLMGEVKKEKEEMKEDINRLFHKKIPRNFMSFLKNFFEKIKNLFYSFILIHKR
jgi:predicted PurR-regulated permease PerM